MKYLKLVRIENLVMVMVIQLLMYYCIIMPIYAKYQLVPSFGSLNLFFLVLGTTLIMAGGNIINDYFDTHIDEINKPDEVIVGKTIHRREAMTLHQVITGVGVLSGLYASYRAGSISMAFVFIIVPGLLWFYASVYKRQFLIGNLIVSLLCALVPILIFWAEKSILSKDSQAFSAAMPALLEMSGWIGAYALFAFLTTLIREITKDLEDEEGDRELECRTLPIVAGHFITKVILSLLSLLTVVLLGYTFIIFWSGGSFFMAAIYLMGTVIVPLLIYIFIAIRSQDVHGFKTAGNLMKFIMISGSLFALIVYHILQGN